MRGTAPTSQRDRPISFVLEVGGEIQQTVTLSLRPEDFSLAEPSRTTVHHTLGGAWADCFGPGLPTISLSGHTGWRPDQSGADGEARWKALREAVFTRWHEERRVAVEQGRDPADVRLIYSDALSDLSVVVAPGTLTLRRSRSRPLLLAYSLPLTVLDRNDDQRTFLAGRPAAEDATGEYEETEDLEAPMDACMDDMEALKDDLAGMEDFLESDFLSAMSDFADAAFEVFDAGMALLQAGLDIANDAIGFICDIAEAGMNLFYGAVGFVQGVVNTVVGVVNGVVGFVGGIAGAAMGVVNRLCGIASAFNGILCFFRRIRRPDLYLDASSFFGASGCSSSAGGRPPSLFANRNTWDFVPFSASGLGYSTGFRLTDAGADGIAKLKDSDPILEPLPKEDLFGACKDAGGGFEVLEA